MSFLINLYSLIFLASTLQIFKQLYNLSELNEHSGGGIPESPNMKILIMIKVRLVDRHNFEEGNRMSGSNIGFHLI